LFSLYDKLEEGKSTFFVEMEETKRIVENSTKNSLVIIDELGRGTSTYDGLSLAYGVLRYITENINCKTLFATHYHILLD
jgi:DNA mismatch repair ATPase MutS